MAKASCWPPTLRRLLLSTLVLSILLPLRGIGQPRQPSYQLAGISAGRLLNLPRLPTQWATNELLAAEALGYVAGSDRQRSRTLQLRTGSWWAWLSAGLLAAALLWTGLALRSARRFNRELAAQVMGLLQYVPATLGLLAGPPAPTAVAPLPTQDAPPPLALPVAPQQQQAIDELRQAAGPALEDADFGPTQLAERLALGERTLYRYIKELVGLTPAAYLRELRLQHAHHLLETQACPTVADAAYQSGFNDPSYFGQVFQKRFGKKPSAYL